MATVGVTVMGERPASRTPALLELFFPPAAKAGGGVAWLVVTNVLLLAIPRLVNEGVAAVEGKPPRATSVLAPFGVDHPTLMMIVGAIAAAAVVGGVARIMSRLV